MFRPNAKYFMQVVLVCLWPFRHNSLKMCAAARNREKVTKTLYFQDSKSFKVIDVDSHKKLVISACCAKQHVCAYLLPFLLAKAECFARLCHRLGVRLSVRHTRQLYQNGAS